LSKPRPTFLFNEIFNIFSKIAFFAISQVAISFPAAIIINEKTAPPT